MTPTEEKLVFHLGRIAAICQGRGVETNPEGAIRQIRQQVDFAMVDVGLADLVPPDELTAGIEAETVAPMVAIGNLHVASVGKDRFAVAVNGAMVEAASVDVSLRQGEPPQARIEFFPAAAGGGDATTPIESEVAA